MTWNKPQRTSHSPGAWPWQNAWGRLVTDFNSLRPQLIQRSHQAMQQLRVGRPWAGLVFNGSSTPSASGRHSSIDASGSSLAAERGGGASSAGPRHVIFFANGLFGSPANWGTVVEEIEKKMDISQV